MNHGEGQSDGSQSGLERMNSVSPPMRAGTYTTDGDGEGISPMMLGKSKELDGFELEPTKKHRHRHHLHHALRRKHSKLNGQTSNASPVLNAQYSLDGQASVPLRTSEQDDQSTRSHSHQSQRVNVLLDEITVWLKNEKAKKKERKAKRKAKRKVKKGPEQQAPGQPADDESHDQSRRSSHSSGSSDLDLTKLESIIEKGMRSSTDLTNGAQMPHISSALNLRRAGSKSYRQPPRRTSTLKPTGVETGEEDELPVPGCDVILDNSKTVQHPRRASTLAQGQGEPEDPWSEFKNEIVRLSHTLKLKGWRHLPRSESDRISVERLSGALTNAVYVVSPPSDFYIAREQDGQAKAKGEPRRQPVKLLLRIYGPNTDQLIDRDAELRILCRLAKKNIGPRLLGTFTNGRFEEFLYAHTLTFDDIRQPDTSKQIAKRMRELHDGIELLDSERNAGPFVWQNWDKSVDRAEETMRFVDGQAQTGHRSSRLGLRKRSKPTGLVCGTDWKTFRKVVEKYRKHLEKQYGGAEKLNEQLVFAHNDAQYGNILRLEPPGESPLMKPANVHKRLVVIDFEYANANVPGLEFANHFTEWCYNYHDPSGTYKCNTSNYPTVEEQIRFLRSYIAHSPSHKPAAPSTPRFTPAPHEHSFSSLDLDASTLPATTASDSDLTTSTRPSTATDTRSIYNLDDARNPNSSSTSLTNPTKSASKTSTSTSTSTTAANTSSTSNPGSTGSYFPTAPQAIRQNRLSELEKAEEDAAVQEEIRRLLRETQMWRMANSAQWVVWGILQAQIPGLHDKQDHDGDSKDDADAGVKADTDEAKGSQQLRSDPLDAQDAAAKSEMADKRPEPAEGEDPANADAEEEGHEEFDYLAYARERAMFFWGDALQMGFVSERELGKEVLGRVKRVVY